jgi:hypothetical protein
VLMAVLFHVLKETANRYVLYYQLLNCLLLVPGIIYSVRKRKKRGDYKYLDALMAGLLCSVTAAFLFNLYLVIYLNFINPVFMQYVLKYGMLGEFMSPLIIGSVFLTEEVTAGLIITLVSVNYLKS